MPGKDAEPTRSQEDASEARAHVEKHLELFNAGAAEEISQQMFAAPVHYTTRTGHGTAATTADVQRMFETIFEAIRGRGWVRSTTHELDAFAAGDGVAFVELIYSRMDVHGKAIPPEKRATLYVLKKLDAGWRIVALYSHDSTRALDFTARTES